MCAVRRRAPAGCFGQTYQVNTIATSLPVPELIASFGVITTSSPSPMSRTRTVGPTLTSPTLLSSPAGTLEASLFPAAAPIPNPISLLVATGSLRGVRQVAWAGSSSRRAVSTLCHALLGVGDADGGAAIGCGTGVARAACAACAACACASACCRATESPSAVGDGETAVDPLGTSGESWSDSSPATHTRSRTAAPVATLARRRCCCPSRCSRPTSPCIDTFAAPPGIEQQPPRPLSLGETITACTT